MHTTSRRPEPTEYHPPLRRAESFGVHTSTGWVETDQFHPDCGICIASGAHPGPHTWMGVPLV